MSSQTIGVEPLRLGIASFQATFSFCVQVVAKSALAADAVRFGAAPLRPVIREERHRRE